MLIDTTVLDDITLGWLGKTYPEKESESNQEKAEDEPAAVSEEEK